MAANLNKIKLKFSSVTVTYNDAAHLNECLKALDFCDEKIVVDMGSIDDSVAIAKKNKARVFHHKRVDVVEKIRKYAINLARNDWIVLIDPDEIFPSKAINKIVKIINSQPKIGIFMTRRVNYFLGNPVKYGMWGISRSSCPAPLNRKRVIFRGLVHKGIKLKKGFKKIIFIDYTTKHYWVDSMEQFWEKHKRYLEDEGRTRYKVGQRFSWIRMPLSLVHLFWRGYIKNLGILDFKNGLRLMRLNLWYEFNAWMELKKYQDSFGNAQDKKIC